MRNAWIFVMKTLVCPTFVRLPSPFCSLALLPILMMALVTLPARGNIVWCGPVATGNGSGADSNDLESIASVNNSWPVTAGGQLNLCGTFTNINEELNVSASGTPGNPITIYFEPNAQFVASYWPSTAEGGAAGGAINIMGQNYIVVNGGANGLIEATNNGSSLQYQTSSAGVGASSSSYLTVENLRIIGMYVRTKDSDDAPAGNAGGIGVQNICVAAPYGITNFMVTNCTIVDAYSGIDSDYGTACKNYIFIGNTISRCNWGGRCGDRGNGSTITNLVVAYNNISNFTNWNDPASDDFHHNGFYGWAESGGVLEGALVYGNLIGPNYGGAYSTSGVFFSGQDENIWIFNNIFVCNANDNPADGLITLGYDAGYGGTILFANNTFLGGGSTVAIAFGGPSRNLVYNNLAENCTFIEDSCGCGGTNIFNYNFGYNLIPGEEYIWDGSFDTFAQWQAVGFDLQGSDTINPLLNSNGTLQTGSPMDLAGINLSSYFTTDFAGNPRPPTGNWTVGAYQVASGTGGAPAISLADTSSNSIVSMSNPGSPTNCTPTTVILTWSSANATNVTLSGFGSVPLNGSTNSSPSQTTNYTVTATGPGGTNSAIVTVPIPAAPTNLKASPL